MCLKRCIMGKYELHEDEPYMGLAEFNELVDKVIEEEKRSPDRDEA